MSRILIALTRAERQRWFRKRQGLEQRCLDAVDAAIAERLVRGVLDVDLFRVLLQRHEPVPGLFVVEQLDDSGSYAVGLVVPRHDA